MWNRLTNLDRYLNTLVSHKLRELSNNYTRLDEIQKNVMRTTTRSNKNVNVV